jgi:hypothetical protein
VALRQAEIKRTKTVCTYCGVGCSFEIWTRDRHILFDTPVIGSMPILFSSVLTKSISGRFSPSSMAVNAVCTYCGVGCSFEIWTRDRHILKVQPVADAPANGIGDALQRFVPAGGPEAAIFTNKRRGQTLRAINEVFVKMAASGPPAGTKRCSASPTVYAGLPSSMAAMRLELSTLLVPKISRAIFCVR